MKNHPKCDIEERKKQLKKAYPELKQFAKGKRSIVFSLGIKYCIKLSSGKVSLAREYTTLQLLNKHKIGPKAILYDKALDALVMEKIQGMFIEEFASKEKSRIRVLSAVYNVASQLFQLDKLKLSKQEMHHPPKHIIVSKKGPVLIDFERCRYSEKPKNMTQFFQYLSEGALYQILKKRGFVLFNKTLKNSLQSYKNSYSQEDFFSLLSLLWLYPETDFEKIYTATRLIPKGKLSTYRDIAEISGTLPIVAGFAMNKNMFFPVVPCHRVVSAEGIGGFASGIENKRRILSAEGINLGKLSSQVISVRDLSLCYKAFIKKLESSQNL